MAEALTAEILLGLEKFALFLLTKTDNDYTKVTERPMADVRPGQVAVLAASSVVVPGWCNNS